MTSFASREIVNRRGLACETLLTSESSGSIKFFSEQCPDWQAGKILKSTTKFQKIWFDFSSISRHLTVSILS